MSILIFISFISVYLSGLNLVSLDIAQTVFSIISSTKFVFISFIFQLLHLTCQF
ncbi:MAG: hypothetical protein Q8S84_04710 [bacterium]|nr:hypothetical protein [bacterium]MDP3380802.1 hypothetical protein [bacterium]